MKTTYTNRYGDEIVFEQVAPNKIEMTGYFSHFRVGFADSDPKEYTMVDPSGGPYIGLGSNLGRYFDNNIGKQIVKKIEFGIDKIIFTTNEDN